MVKIEEPAFAGMWITHDFVKKYRLWEPNRGEGKVYLDSQADLSKIMTAIVDYRVAQLDGSMNLQEFIKKAEDIHTEVMSTVGTPTEKQIKQVKENLAKESMSKASTMEVVK